MQVFLKALGCRLNEAELERWSRQFQDRGHRISDKLEDADVVVLNTCAVTEEAVRKSRRLIRRAQRANPLAKLVVSGCYVSLTGDIASLPDGVDLLVTNRDKDRLVELSQEKLQLQAMPHLATEPGTAGLYTRTRHRAFVKVQDGCRYRCTFCVVTVARGPERSRQVGEIIAEINRLVESGIQEVVLTGVHVGGYGSDSGVTLHQLIAAILADTDLPRLRLASVEPWDLPQDFFSLFADPRLMPHMHLPLQSGSDIVLRRMARRCKTADFEKLAEHARSEVPGFGITTDIIVGFPGETERDWQQTVALVEKLRFSHVHIFPYSPRAGTKAAHLPDQLSTAVKKRRVRELHVVSARIKRELLAAAVGRRCSVLFEDGQAIEERAGLRYFGYTPNYMRVVADVTKSLSNQIVEVRIKGIEAGGDVLAAELISRQARIIGNKYA